jgi:hypothetical protein
MCLALPTQVDNDDARRAIEWWHEPVTFDCGVGSIQVRQGPAPSWAPAACGWNDGTQIVWTCGPIFAVVRHEFGHTLGYGDTLDGVMGSGTTDEVPAGGTW